MNNFAIWLGSEFSERQTQNSNFSLRAFARYLGVSAAQLSQMMAGKRNISTKMAKKIMARLGTPPSEQLRLLSANLDLETTQAAIKTSLAEDQFRLISDWYHFAILSLTHLKNASSDARWIARRLGISSHEANAACARLVRLGLLELSPRFRQVGNPIEVFSSIPSEAIRKFHKQKLQLAAEKIETTDLNLREFQSVVLAIAPSKIPLAKKMMAQAIDEISLVLEAKNPKEVYSFSMQLFPLTQGDLNEK